MAHPGYCDQSDIEDRYRAENLRDLSDYDGDNVADSDVITQAIQDACHEMDGYLQVKFGVPIVPAPDCLRRCAVTIAWYYLQLGRESVTEDAREAYKQCIDQMKDIASGKMAIGVEPKPTESTGAATVHYDAEDRVFGRSKRL